MGPTIPGDGGCDGDGDGKMKIITNLKRVKRWSSGSEGRSGIHFWSWLKSSQFLNYLFCDLQVSKTFIDWWCWHVLTLSSKRSWENYLCLKSESDSFNFTNLHNSTFSEPNMRCWGPTPFMPCDGNLFNTSSKFKVLEECRPERPGGDATQKEYFRDWVLNPSDSLNSIFLIRSGNYITGQWSHRFWRIFTSSAKEPHIWKSSCFYRKGLKE